MKRFTDTRKFADPWYRRLEPRLKCFWEWLLAECNSAGVIDIDWPLAAFAIGAEISEDDMQQFTGRVEKLPCGKWFIQKFVAFQYGQLSKECRPHGKVIEEAEAAGVLQRVSKGYPKGIGTLQAADKEEEEDKKGGCKGGDWVEMDPDRQWVIAKKWLEDWRKSGADYSEFEARGAFLALQAGGWTWGKKSIADPRAALERQIQTDRERKPKHENNGRTNRPGVDRNAGTLNQGKSSQYAGVGKVE